MASSPTRRADKWSVLERSTKAVPSWEAQSSNAVPAATTANASLVSPMTQTSSCDVSGSDGRRVFGEPPLRPGPVVDGRRFVAEQKEPERHDAGGDPRAACRYDGALEIDACRLEARRERIGRNESPRFRINQIRPWNIDGVWDVSELLGGIEVFLGAIEFAGTTGVNDLFRAAYKIGLHLAQSPHKRGKKRGREAARFGPDRGHIRGEILLRPFAIPPVQHRHFFVAEDPEHPPSPCRR